MSADNKNNKINNKLNNNNNNKSKCTKIKGSDIKNFPERHFNNLIYSKKELKVMCNDAAEINIFEDKKLTYKPVIFASTEDGSKLAIMLDDVDVFFDVQVPKASEKNIDLMRNEIISYLKGSKIEVKRTKYIERKWYRSLLNFKFIRIYFYSSIQRKKALKCLDERTSPVRKNKWKYYKRKREGNRVFRIYL